MKTSINSLKALAVGTALATASVAMQAVPANALSISFEPTGSTSLDGDPVTDIATSVGSTLDFILSLETNGVPEFNTINSVEYLLTWDPSELSYGGFSTIFPSGNPLGNIFGQTLDAVSGSLAITTTGSALRKELYEIGKISFTVLSGLNNDTAFDFSSDLTKALNQDGVTLANLVSSQVQTVEVQGTDVPTPALLPGLIGMGMALVRKRRAQSEEQAA